MIRLQWHPRGVSGHWPFAATSSSPSRAKTRRSICRGSVAHRRCPGPPDRRVPNPRTACRGSRGSVATAHGDHDIGGPNDLIGPRFGVLLSDVDATFGHRGNGRSIDYLSRLSTPGPSGGLVSGVVVEEAQRHLGPTCVVDAEEQHEGLPSLPPPSIFAIAWRRCRANRSASNGKKLSMVAFPANSS